MSTNPPVPPPLPADNTITPLKLYQIQNSLSDSICQWTTELELREACAKNNICLYKAPHQFKYKNFKAITQVGPTCGLVALSMLLNGEVSPDELLNIVIAEGYSNNGEMFSCQNMVQLVEKVLNLSKKNNASFHLRHGLYSKEIILELLNGATLLVAYDADCNHSPCLRNGHTAHWALVCGIIIIDDPNGYYLSDPNNIYIFCRHGKSKYLAMWRLADLDSSNKNLNEFNPKKKEDGLLYILPEGGMGGKNGLKGQFVMFKGL
ncbi:unnamed protein product [Pieris macdunnoughi]|uniref:Actin maturation protease n=1 Tax=Pieris macdunnoughi TaxID=345717 RepID=A0A821P6V3_9NEOP|nr:unnamed protein product [Pieris macdunnoughi]